MSDWDSNGAEGRNLSRPGCVWWFWRFREISAVNSLHRLSPIPVPIDKVGHWQVFPNRHSVAAGREPFGRWRDLISTTRKERWKLALMNHLFKTSRLDKENVRPADRKANIFARNHADGDDKFEIPASSTGEYEPVEWKKPLEPRSSPSHGGPKHIPSMRNPSLPSNEYRDMYSSPVVQGSRKRPLEPIRGGTSGNRRRRIPGPAGEIEASTRTEPSVDGQRYPDFKSKWDFHGWYNGCFFCVSRYFI
eukprot:458988-Amorphochlora_amoeboformis.AAC.1